MSNVTLLRWVTCVPKFEDPCGSLVWQSWGLWGCLKRNNRTIKRDKTGGGDTNSDTLLAIQAVGGPTSGASGGGRGRTHKLLGRPNG